MYSKFNYNPSYFFYNNTLNDYLQKGNELYQRHEEEVKKCLSEYITVDGIINTSKLKADWFSITKKDIFISHSHQDIERVKAFAGWLYENFGLEAFVDCCSWGYCDELLQKIDKKYCYNPKRDTYNYSLRNYTTSHVHMMLSTALTEMMNQTECVIFFNTPNSINMSEELKKIDKNKKTLSPWIYHELLMTSLLKENKPDKKQFILEYAEQRADNVPKFAYDVQALLDGLTTLTDQHLTTWLKMWNDRPLKLPEEALEVLYQVVFPLKK